MRILRHISRAFIIAMMCLAMTACINKNHNHEGTLNPQQANQQMQKWGKKLIILDVRLPEEFKQGHIPGAISMPVENITPEKVATLPDGPILIICRCGVRAHDAYHKVLNAQPQRKDVTYLNGTTRFHSDGTYTFE